MVESSSDMSLQRKKHSWLSPIGRRRRTVAKLPPISLCRATATAAATAATAAAAAAAAAPVVGAF
jgi:hypothetical protein